MFLVSASLSSAGRSFSTGASSSSDVSAGVGALKALAGPLPHLQFMPTGGVSADNAGEYLALPNVVAVGGSWIATEKDVTTGAWSEVAQKARTALSKI